MFQRSMKATGVGATNQNPDLTRTFDLNYVWATDWCESAVTLSIVGSVVRPTRKLYGRFLYSTQSAPDNHIWTFLLLFGLL